MTDLFSPGSLTTVIGAMLTVIGAVAYFTGAANLSVPTLFYGFPIFLGGLALKNSELPPAQKISSESINRKGTPEPPEELKKLVKDVTRWRYGQRVHLESSLQALKLWDEINPPQLIEIEELAVNNGYGIRMHFKIGGVSIERWQEKKARLGRFFAKGLEAEIVLNNAEELDLVITPKTNNS